MAGLAGIDSSRGQYTKAAVAATKAAAVAARKAVAKAAALIDTGMGISEADQKRIFEPFERGTGSGEVKGLGLGLAISRQLATARPVRSSV